MEVAKSVFKGIQRLKEISEKVIFYSSKVEKNSRKVMINAAADSWRGNKNQFVKKKG